MFFKKLCSSKFRGTAGVVNCLSSSADGIKTHTELHIETHFERLEAVTGWELGKVCFNMVKKQGWGLVT